MQPAHDSSQFDMVVRTEHLDADVEFFRSLGFRVDRIEPADAPRLAWLSGHGKRLGLESSAVLENAVAFGSQSQDASQDFEVSPADAAWHRGRAGMEYRDLVPGRLGGALIASHIRIREGGIVPDYEHYHEVQFQLIYVLRGWVRVVYEDQGEPFVMRPGDCVLQPSEIRHRVLECSDGLEVVEVGGPAHHATFGEHEFTLPNGPSHNPDREFGRRQRFQFFESSGSPASTDHDHRVDLGMLEPTRGVVSATVETGSGRAAAAIALSSPEIVFGFVLDGQLRVQWDDDQRSGRQQPIDLEAGAAFAAAGHGCSAWPAGGGEDWNGEDRNGEDQGGDPQHTRWLRIAIHPEQPQSG